MLRNFMIFNKSLGKLFRNPFKIDLMSRLCTTKYKYPIYGVYSGILVIYFDFDITFSEKDRENLGFGGTKMISYEKIRQYIRDKL